MGWGCRESAHKKSQRHRIGAIMISPLPGIFADLVDDQGESVFADVVCRRARR
jgi:hypothetical protein